MALFPQDLLIIDFEATGANPAVDAPVQLAAVLLDSTTLVEKDSFTTLIAADVSGMSEEVKKIVPITQEMLTGAPTAAEVITRFVTQFGHDVLLGSWVQNFDRTMLARILEDEGLEWPYDYHFLDLWPIAYAHLIKQGYTGSMRSEEIFRAFGLPPRGHHDALEDCRHEAEVLRLIMLSGD